MIKKIRFKNQLPTEEELQQEIRETYSYEDLVHLTAFYALECEKHNMESESQKKIAITQEAFDAHFRIIGADGRGRRKKKEQE